MRIELCRVPEADHERITAAAKLAGRSVSDYGTRALSKAAKRTMDETCSCEISPFPHARSRDCSTPTPRTLP